MPSINMPRENHGNHCVNNLLKWKHICASISYEDFEKLKHCWGKNKRSKRSWFLHLEQICHQQADTWAEASFFWTSFWQIWADLLTSVKSNRNPCRLLSGINMSLATVQRDAGSYILGKSSVPPRADSQHGSVSAAVTLSELWQQGIETLQMYVRQDVFTLRQGKQQHVPCSKPGCC